jgi:rifampicin phosphotransferase
MGQNVMARAAAPATELIPLERATDPTRCGQKAAALASLIGHGFDVPRGFVIPVGVPVPSEGELASALALLGDRAVAVRSSGAAEDLADASYAGQYDTVLGVRGAGSVADAAARVLASAGARRTAGYGDPGAMAVLVQVMVEADTAGVAFSANPLTGDRDEVCVNATRGLADRMVSGATDGEEWSVRGDVARCLNGGPNDVQAVLDQKTVQKVAELVRRVEAARGAPQDIEWATEGGRLLLLQARPITALPVAPEIDVPKGTWQKDHGHFPLPISPFAASTHLKDAGQGQPMVDEWGLMPDSMTIRVIGHEFYVHIEPDDGGGNPPPWWVLGLAARLIPSLRRKLEVAQRAIEGGLLESLPKQWETELKPKLAQEVRAYARIDLGALGDEHLFEHLDELTAFSVRNLQLHFRLNMPFIIGVHDLAKTCKELLGWDAPRALELLQGLSTATSAPLRELAAVAELARARPRAAALIRAGTPDLEDRLSDEDPEVAKRLRSWLEVWGIRTIGGEAGAPSVAECPELVAQMLADLLEDSRTPDVAERRTALAAEARSQLRNPKQRARFDRVLAYAERSYPLREDNVILTDHLPVGLIRRVALEAGRRLVRRGALSNEVDALMLTAGELRGALVEGDGAADQRAKVSTRRSEHAWVRAHPGPSVYGKSPGKLPDLRGLPEAARRVNEALLWEMESEWGAPEATGGTTLVGIAASPGSYRGRVRVIRSPEQLGLLRAGEVLVCPETSSAWMMVFRRAGALVTDHGSTLSHTAIVAREFALPAVVAIKAGTTRLRDGEEVIVDGSKGTVTRC